MAKPVHRRQFLKLAGTALLAPSLLAEAQSGSFQLAQLRYGPNANPRPTALRRLLWELSQRTAVDVSLEPVWVAPESPSLFQFPLIYLAGEGRLPPLSDVALRHLRRHLTYGGMLLVDSSEAEPGGPFDLSLRAALSQLFPRQQLSRVPTEHVMYKSFYLVNHQAGRVLRRPYLEGLELDGRFAVVYSQNDLGGAWARDAFGRWEFEVSPGGERQREMSFRLGVNLLMYALCLDYKDDLVHAPFILRRSE